MKLLSILASCILAASSANALSINFKFTPKSIQSESVNDINTNSINAESMDDILNTKFANPLSEPQNFRSRKHGAPIVMQPTTKHIKDQYVVVLHDHLDHVFVHQQLTAVLHEHDHIKTQQFKGIHAKPFKVHDGLDSIKGFFAHLSEEVLNILRTRPEIKYIEPDAEVHTMEVEHNAPWGLARISHRRLPSQQMKQDYIYDPHEGHGVTAYVIDTGINVNHTEFGGRARWGATIPEDDEDEDGNGHGSHVAGTIGGSTYGVAKGVNLVAVKVLRSNGGGTLSDVIRGIEWAVEDCKSQKTSSGKKAKCVANMSLGGGRSPSLDQAVNAAVSAGLYFAVAAGNDGMDACNYSPAASDKAITVGATQINDRMAWFSNHGKCVDIFGPGHQILSSWTGSNDATNTISGTSMASPHIAGVLALLLSEPKYADLSPKELKEKVTSMATSGVITGLPFWTQSKNRLVWDDPPRA